MSSKLFHTVVAFGIALGATASVGCGSATEDPSGETAVTSSRETTTPAPSAESGGPSADSFCDATWPTTKGANFRPPPACVDPNHECSAPTSSGGVAARPKECVKVTDGVCSYERGTYSVCVDAVWTCKPGRMAMEDCTCFEGDPNCHPSTGASPAPN
jgi:hypothetical protein